MPLFQAAAAAGRGGVLGDEYRVSAHRSLFAIVRNLRRSQAPGDKISRVLVDNFRPLIIAILAFLYAEAKAGAKSGTLQTGKQVFLLPHSQPWSWKYVPGS